jgi:hypothetical protein
MRRLGIAAALGVVLLLAACGGSSSTRPSDKPAHKPTPPTPPPGYVSCGVGRARVKPSHLLCGGAFQITGVRWLTWEHRRATGKATGRLACGTACIAGDPKVFPLRIELSQPVSCGNGSAPQFMLLSLRIIGPTPTHTGRNLSFHSNCPVS